MGKKLCKPGIIVVFSLFIFASVIACDRNAIGPEEEDYEEINFENMLSLEREWEKEIEVDETAYNLSLSPDGSRFVYYQASLWPMARLVDINGKEYKLPPLETDNASRGAVSWYDDHKLAYVSLSGFIIDPENLDSHIYLYDPDSGEADIIDSPVRLLDNTGVAVINSKYLLALSLEGLYRYSLEEEKWDLLAPIPDSAEGFLWSGDYSKAAYTTMPEPSRNLYILETSTGQQDLISVDYPGRLALVCKDEEKNDFIITVIKPEGTEVYSKILKVLILLDQLGGFPIVKKSAFGLKMMRAAI